MSALPAPPNPGDETILGIPINRVVAFIGPYVATGSGIVVAWLIGHVHFLALLHFGHDKVAAGVAQLVVFVVTSGLVWLGHQKWLTGHQIVLAAQSQPATGDVPVPPTFESASVEKPAKLRPSRTGAPKA